MNKFDTLYESVMIEGCDAELEEGLGDVLKSLGAKFKSLIGNPPKKSYDNVTGGRDLGALTKNLNKYMPKDFSDEKSVIGFIKNIKAKFTDQEFKFIKDYVFDDKTHGILSKHMAI
jgi:hypothetical protein